VTFDRVFADLDEASPHPPGSYRDDDAADHLSASTTGPAQFRTPIGRPVLSDL
jgi:hypothetical protein